MQLASVPESYALPEIFHDNQIPTGSGSYLEIFTPKFDGNPNYSV
jgi:hypothetical protein